jgi:hypothetical protein
VDEATAPIARSGRARRRVTHPIQALLRPPLQPRIEWPSIEQEMKDYLPLFTGEVLNAGAGRRDLQPWIPGRLTNQDLPS